MIPQSCLNTGSNELIKTVYLDNEFELVFELGAIFFIFWHVL